MENASYLPNRALKVESVPLVGRKLRRPTHSFMVKHRPFAIQPFFIAPVLPGDTMKNLLLQAKVITDPVKHPFLGWWSEFYFFYVKLRDLPERDSIEQMLIAGAAAPAATAASKATYYNGTGVNWALKCRDRIVDCYFRSEEEVAVGLPRVHGDGVGTEDVPVCKLITAPGWTESMLDSVDTPESDGTPLAGDLWPDLPPNLAGFQAAYTEWQRMQSLEIVPPKFEDYLKTFGINAPKSEKENPHIPELLRYVRNFKQPTNVVGEQGTVNSQVVWDIAERADKDRFFAEPGFIVGIHTARAKMYAGKQVSCMASFLNDNYSWLPALLQPDPFTSLKKFLASTGPTPNITDDYWVDLADLFTGGDQFHNYDTTADPGFYTGPQFEPDATYKGHIALFKDYPLDTDVNNLFKAPTDMTKTKVRLEGRVDLGILSRVQDTTP